jgi:hypothetical protein
VYKRRLGFGIGSELLKVHFAFELHNPACSLEHIQQ